MDALILPLKVRKIFFTVILPSFLAVGVSFNITVLCVWIFGQKSKQLCCATYFASNAAFDLIFLLVSGTSLYVWRLLLNLPAGDTFLAIYLYTYLWLLAISNWISVAITVERALTVLWPFVFKPQDMKNRSKYVVLAICVLLTATYVAINSFENQGIPDLVETVVATVLPFILIFTFNSVVLATLCRNKLQEHTVSSNHSRYVDVFTKITISTGLSFVVSNSLLLTVYVRWWTDSTVVENDIWWAVIFTSMAPVMYFLNSVLNPVICFVVCKGVREDMWACACMVVKCCGCNKSGQGTEAVAVQVAETAHV